MQNIKVAYFKLVAIIATLKSNNLDRKSVV